MSLRCVQLRDSSLWEGRKLNTIVRRNVEWFLEQVLGLCRDMIDSDMVSGMRVESHHSANGQIGTVMSA